MTTTPTPWALEYTPSLEGDIAAAICGHAAVAISNVEELDIFHGFVQEQLERLRNAAKAEGIREAESVAKSHKGSAAKERPRKHLPRPGFGFDEAMTEIYAEERGEDIASDMIAQKIRGLLPPEDEGRTYECMIDGNCRRLRDGETMSPSALCKAAKRCLAAVPPEDKT